MKKWIITIIALMAAVAVQANIIDDPTFASVNDGTLNSSLVGNGWYSDVTSGDFRFSAGVATSDRQWSPFYFYQAIDDNGSTTGSQDFSFDFDGSAIVAWAQSSSPIYYDIWGAVDGWGGTFNSGGTGTAKTGLTSLLSGSITGFDVTPTGTYSTSVDFGAGYDQIIVRFGANISGPSTSEASIADISLGSTVVPEPATVGMLGLGALISLLIRRIRA